MAIVNHIVVTLGISCAANIGFPMKGKPAQHTPIPNLYAIHQQTSALGQICALVLCVATNYERLEAWHLGR